MKSFLVKCALFVAVITFYFLVNYSINTLLASKNPPQLDATTLIMGDSHIMMGLDPDQFYHAKNIAQEGEPYAATYFKLRELVKHNHIDTLILGFSIQNMAEFNDQKFTDRFWSDELFDRMYPIATWRDFKNYEINSMSFVRSWVKNMLLIPKQNHHPYIGKFTNSKGTLSKLKQRPHTAIKRHFYYHDKETKLSPLCKYYLDAIIGISNEYRIKIIFVNTPVHASYRNLVPLKFAEDFKQLNQLLIAKDIQVVDLSGMNLSDDCYKDYDHVNGKGAKIITKELIRQLKRSMIK